MAGSLTITLSGLTDTMTALGLLGPDPKTMLGAVQTIIGSVLRGKHVSSPEFALNYSTSDAVKASATATLVNAGATDSITINGVEFAAVVSGATGNQWNIGADDSADAANLAAAINASTSGRVAGYVTATVAANVVTIEAVVPGVAGNAFTLVDTGTTITVTGSGFLAGGTGGNTSASFSSSALAAL